jgi:hypothetical protein
MATVVFTAIGAAFGGPVGAAIGAIVGSQVDAEIFRGADRQGPRVKDLSITTSAYGAALPRHFGKMRVGGSVIWATDLVEHSSSSSGKGKPTVTTYNYTSSFAVALGSRPIDALGRVWADGKLLRGAAGDLKVGGSLRFYGGTGSQGPDPLIASQVGLGSCPAFRGTAYAVFEDLQLEEFGNRIPSLNFEIFCDEGALTLDNLFAGAVDGVDGAIPLDGIQGYSCSEPLANTLTQFLPVLPMLCDAGGDRLTIARERLQAGPVAIGEPAVASSKGRFGGKLGFTRKRNPPLENLPGVLRYYDVERDYQPGSQRAPGKAAQGQPKTIDLPAAMNSADAFRRIAQAARNGLWARETIAWHCAELDPNVAPGTIVALSGVSGRWRVLEWEWRESGVQVLLERISLADNAIMNSASAGQSIAAADLLVTPSRIVALELPWDGNGSAGTRSVVAAVSSAEAGWKGAAIYADSGTGQLTQIATSNRERSTIGTCLSALPAGPVTLFDRSSALTVQLLGADMALAGASAAALTQGANRALVGQEIIQFGKATALGSGVWRLEQLLRGRGGTERAVDSHVANESFVLLDAALSFVRLCRCWVKPSWELMAV